jgi:hypothetical protein
LRENEECGLEVLQTMMSKYGKKVDYEKSVIE